MQFTCNTLLPTPLRHCIEYFHSLRDFIVSLSLSQNYLMLRDLQRLAIRNSPLRFKCYIKSTSTLIRKQQQTSWKSFSIQKEFTWLERKVVTAFNRPNDKFCITWETTVTSKYQGPTIRAHFISPELVH